MVSITPEARCRIRAQAKRDTAHLSNMDLLDLLKYVSGETQAGMLDLIALTAITPANVERTRGEIREMIRSAIGDNPLPKRRR